MTYLLYVNFIQFVQRRNKNKARRKDNSESLMKSTRETALIFKPMSRKYVNV